MAWYPVVGLLIGSGLIVADWGLTAMLSPAGRECAADRPVGAVDSWASSGRVGRHIGWIGRRPYTGGTVSIMRDPRIGAIGATGLFLSLILRYAGLMVLPHELRLPAVLCMPAMGRWAMVTLAWISPYARMEGGLAAPFLTHLSWRHVAISTVVLTMALAVGFRSGRCMSDHPGPDSDYPCRLESLPSLVRGITGDTLGAANEVIEILFLLFVPLLLRLP